MSSVNAPTSLRHNFLVLGHGGHDKTCMTVIGYIQAFILLDVASELNLLSLKEEICYDWNIQVFHNVNST